MISGERGVGLRRIIEIASHDRRRADLQFADARREAEFGTFHDAERDAFGRPADRAARGGLIVGPHAEIAGARFRKTEEIENAGLRGQRRERFGERGAERLAAREDRAKVCRGNAPGGAERSQQGRDGGEHRDVSALRFQRRGREFRRENEARAGHQAQQAHPDAEDEGELQGYDDDIARRRCDQSLQRMQLPDQPLVSDDDALRLSRASGCEDDDRRASQQGAFGWRRIADALDLSGAESDPRAEPSDQ